MAVLDLLAARKRFRERARAQGVRRLPPAPREPRRARLRYHAALSRLLDTWEGEILREVRPLFEEIERRSTGGRLDAGADDERIQRIRELLRRLASGRAVEETLQRIALEVQGTSDADMRRVLGIDLGRRSHTGPEIAAFLEQNKRLIRSLAEDQADEVARIVASDVPRRIRAEEMAQDLRERLRVPRSRAALIARTETAKLKAQLDRSRQQELGITHYIWRSSDDERVRSRHRQLDGTRHPYAEPPVAEENGDRHHPGEYPNCRCVAIPDTRHIFGDDSTAVESMAAGGGSGGHLLSAWVRG